MSRIMDSGGPTVVFMAPPSPPPTPATPEASLSTQERLRLAKRRRAAQLKRWTQKDREKSHSQPDLIPMNASKKDRVKFVPNIMLLEASARNDLDEVRRLLELGVSPDSTNEDGLTALHQCCIDDSEEMMKILIEYGGNPNATDTEKWTPLHAAATCGHLHLVKFLIDNNADLLAVNADGNMPYDLCEDDTTLSYIENEMAKRGVTQELIDNTRSELEQQMLHDLKMLKNELALECRDGSGATPLHIASANGYVHVVEYLLDHHVSTEVIDNDQWQPIHAAACWGHLEVVELLAQNGANISAKTKNGETPFDICEDPEIKERLIQLKEQRVRLEQPRVRRSRSASTRTQSIRRTSLREKMNTTKKDVQDEKLYFIQSFDAMPKMDQMNAAAHSPSSAEHRNGGSGVVDIKDVELTLLPPDGHNYHDGHHRHGVPDGGGGHYLPSDSSSIPHSSSGSAMAGDQQQQQMHGGIPPRTGSKESPRSGNSPSLASTSSSTTAAAGASTAAKSDKINIHVSVTINASSSQQHLNQLTSGSPSSPHQQQQNHSSSGTTLADLKKARSMSRHAAIPINNSSSSSSSNSNQQQSQSNNPNNSSSSNKYLSGNKSTDRHNMNDPSLASSPLASPIRERPSKTSSKSRSKQGSSSSSGGQANNEFNHYTANEVVGPPSSEKSGCCVII